MGMRSSLVYNEGCNIDIKKLEDIIILLRIDGKLDKYWELEEILENLKDNGSLGTYLSGCKIEGYWYVEFCRTLHILADCMNDLTDNLYDNYIKFDYEGGYYYDINFHRNENNKVVISFNKPIIFGRFEIDKEGDIELVSQEEN